VRAALAASNSEMPKLDLKRVRKELFTAPRGEFAALMVPRVVYLMADGHGDPNASPDYARAVEALYSAAYALKFACKAQGRDFVVAPLEGLWSAADPSSFVERRKHEWDWTMLIMVPDFIDDAAFAGAREKAALKLGQLPPSLRLEALEEGLCLQATTRKGHCWPVCTRRSSRPVVMRSPGRITRSTSATRARPRPRS
jgi:hypothetical protein